MARLLLFSTICSQIHLYNIQRQQGEAFEGGEDNQMQVNQILKIAWSVVTWHDINVLIDETHTTKQVIALIYLSRYFTARSDIDVLWKQVAVVVGGQMSSHTQTNRTCSHYLTCTWPWFIGTWSWCMGNLVSGASLLGVSGVPFLSCAEALLSSAMKTCLCSTLQWRKLCVCLDKKTEVSFLLDQIWTINKFRHCLHQVLTIPRPYLDNV